MMDDNSNFWTRNVMKVVDVDAVNLPGILRYETNDPTDSNMGYAWYVTDSGGTRRCVDDWLEKFVGRRVRITIEAMNERDESHMVEEGT